MTDLTRRSLAGLAGSMLVPGARAASSAPRVVVVGGGAGGATAARYLASFGTMGVTLVEPKARYTTCFSSNLYLAGLRSFESLTHGYESLARQGVTVVQDRATAIDAGTVRLAGGSSLPYDRLVVSPGIAFREGGVEGYDEAAMQVMPHAWEAGPQTVLLRRQLEAMPDGGVFLMAAPPEPFRCPPGPYERACMVASYLKQHKPRSKILILDAKDTFFEEDLFLDAWSRHYPGMIEWLPSQFIGAIEAVDATERSIRTASQTFKGDVVNVIPPQTAGDVARRNGLADGTGWCPVDPATFESTLLPGVHVIGDSAIGGDMPKSAFAANSQAKSCAFAIGAELAGSGPPRPFLYNTCYTYLAPDDAVSDAITFKIDAGRIKISEIEISRLAEEPETRAKGVREADGWYDAFTRDMFG